MKTLALSILCLLAVSGKSQWDSTSVKNRLSLASYHLHEYSTRSLIGAGAMLAGGSIAAFSMVVKKNHPGEARGIIGSGLFLAAFGTVVFITAPIQAKKAAISLSANGASIRF